MRVYQFRHVGNEATDYKVFAVIVNHQSACKSYKMLGMLGVFRSVR